MLFNRDDVGDRAAAYQTSGGVIDNARGAASSKARAHLYRARSSRIVRYHIAWRRAVDALGADRLRASNVNIISVWMLTQCMARRNANIATCQQRSWPAQRLSHVRSIARL